MGISVFLLSMFDLYSLDYTVLVWHPTNKCLKIRIFFAHIVQQAQIVHFLSTVPTILKCYRVSDGPEEQMNLWVLLRS